MHCNKLNLVNWSTFNNRYTPDNDTSMLKEIYGEQLLLDVWFLNEKIMLSSSLSVCVAVLDVLQNHDIH